MFKVYVTSVHLDQLL